MRIASNGFARGFGAWVALALAAAGCGGGGSSGGDGAARDQAMMSGGDLSGVIQDLTLSGGDAAAGADMSMAQPDMFMFCNLHGKVQQVDAFADYKIQIVTAFPDVNVQQVDAFPDQPGQWQMVTAFPDFTVQVVTAFPDFKVQYVNAFPGCP